jgi:membrane-associated phospholipid phosphatase
VNGIRLRPGRPLLAVGARPWAGALGACCAVLVAVLGVLFAHQVRADGFDHAIDSRVIAWLGGHRGLLLWLAAPGSLIPAGVLCAAIVAACLLAGRLNGALLAAAAVPVAVGLDEALLKPLVHRTYWGSVVYPSGHTTAVFTLAATLTVLLLASPRPVEATAVKATAVKTAAPRVLIPAAACALGLVVAVAVIGLQWHYFTDTVAGAAVAIGTVCGLALLLDLRAVRRWLAWVTRQPPEAAGRQSHPARAGTGASG